MQNWTSLTPERRNALGYEVRHFAHRHRIPTAVAQRLIDEIGPDRAKLDEAARHYVASRFPNKAGELVAPDRTECGPVSD